MSALRLVSCLLLAASLSGSLGAQSPAPVVLDITALDVNGVPVTTLRPGDLSLRINGREHAVTDLVLVQHRDPPASPLPAPYATNQVPPGRTMAIAIDVTRVPASVMPAVHTGVTSLLTALHGNDRVALVALALDGFALDFTTRHARVGAVTGAMKGRVAEITDAREAEAAAAASLGMLQRLVAGLAVEPGLKTVVFVSTPFIASSSTIRRAIQSVADAAAHQRVQLVVVASAPGSGTGLAALAAATGGELLPAGAGLGSVASRSASRYELTFSPSSKLSHDELQRVQLVSLRSDVRVTAPVSVAIPSPDTVPLGMVALADMLGQPRAYRDLPLRMAVYPVMDTERDRLRLLILGEPEDPSRTLAWVELALIAPSGAVVSRWKVESADAAARPMMTAALAPEGAYRLRMAASELSGRRGTVDLEFDARLTPAGAFALGPVMFGAMSAEAFIPQLQPPAGADAIMAYAEIYGESADTDTWSATFEMAQTTTGPAISTTPASVRKTPDARRRAALATLDLTSLTAGDYQIRAIVSRNGAEIGRVTQTLRKAVR